MYENSCLKMFKPLTLGLFLTNTKIISKTSINKYADVGYPCRVFLSNLKYLKTCCFSTVNDARIMIF